MVLCSRHQQARDAERGSPLFGLDFRYRLNDHGREGLDEGLGLDGQRR